MLSRDLRGACSELAAQICPIRELTALRTQFSKPRRAVGMYSHSTLHQTWQMQNHSNLHPAFWAAQEQQQQR